jgi:hypothetical protein
MDNSPKIVDEFEVIDEEISIQKDNRDDENIAAVVGSISSRKKAKLYEEFEKLDDEMSISKLVYSEQLHQGKNSI